MKLRIFLISIVALITAMTARAEYITPFTVSLYDGNVKLTYDVNDDAQSVSLISIYIENRSSYELEVPAKVKVAETRDGITYEHDMAVTTLRCEEGYMSVLRGYGTLTRLVLPPTVTRLENNALSRYYEAIVKYVDLGGNIEYIGNSAFYSAAALTEVANVGTRLQYIGNYAFIKCKNLVTMSIPPTVSEIGEYCFSECAKLETPMSLPLLTVVPKYAFNECNALTELSFGEGLTEVGEYAFAATGVTELAFPNSVKTIGDYACYRSGIKSVTLGENVENFGTWVFSRSALQEIDWPGSIKTIPNSTFYFCRNMQRLTLGEGLEKIDFQTGCTVANPVVYPQSLKVINSFFSCPNQEAVIIPDGVTTIGTQISTYYNKSLTLGKSVRQLSYEANGRIAGAAKADFYPSALAKLEQLHVRMPEPIEVAYDMTGYYDNDSYNQAFENCTLYIPRGTLALYTDANSEAAAFWRNFKNIVEEDVDTPSLPGDLNGDGSVNAGDVSELYGVILQGNSDKRYDLNSDGSVNAGDVSALYTIILGGR